MANPESVVTKTLVTVNSSIIQAESFVNEAYGPITTLTVEINKLSTYTVKADSCLQSLSSVTKNLRRVLKVLQNVCRYIPEVGPEISSAIRVIERLPILSTIDTVVTDLKKVIDRANDTVIKRVTDAANLVSGHVQTLRNDVPPWKTTTGTLVKLSHIIDFFLLVLFKDMIHLDIKNPFADLLPPIQAVARTATDLKDFCQQVLNSFKTGIMKKLQEGLQPILDGIANIKSTIDSVLDKLEPVEKVLDFLLAPVAPIFDLLNSIFDSTVGKLIDLITENNNIKQVIQDLTDKIKSSLRIDELEAQITQTLGKPLEDFAQTIEDFLNKADLKNIGENIKKVVDTLLQFRNDPANALFNVTLQILNLKRKSGPFDPLDGPTPKQLFMNFSQSRVPLQLALKKQDLSPPAFQSRGSSLLPLTDGLDIEDTSAPEPVSDTHGSEEGETVEQVQGQMDELVRRAWNISNESGLAGIRLSSPSFDLSYALYNGTPVSISLRTAHPQILATMKGLLASEDPPAALPVLAAQIAPRSMMMGMNIAPDAPQASEAAPSPPVQPNGGNAAPNTWPGFSAFNNQYDALTKEISACQSQLEAMKTVAETTDAVVIRYQKGAADFLDQFLSLLNSLEPILAATTGVLNLPIKYETALEKVVQAMKLPQQVSADVLPSIFSTVAGVAKSVTDVQSTRSEISTNATAFSNAYKAIHQHLDQMFAPGHLGKLPDYGVTSFSSLLKSLSQWLARLSKRVEFFKSLGDAMVKDKSQLPADDKTAAGLTQLDATLGKLAPVLEGSIARVKSTTTQASQLFEQLKAVGKDLAQGFDAAGVISEQCRAIEGHLIAANKVKGLCVRIESSIGPFQGLLDQLNVKPDPLTPVPGNPNQAVANQGLPTTLSEVLRGLSQVVCVALDVLIKRYFDLSDIKSTIAATGQAVSAPTASNLGVIDGLMLSLGKLCVPSNAILPPPTSKEPSITILQANLASLAANPLLDDTTSKALQSLAASIGNDLQNAQFAPTGEVSKLLSPSPSEKLASQSALIGDGVVKQAALQTWGNTWDESHPKNPSHVFITWFSLLGGLDFLMQRREAREREMKQGGPNEEGKKQVLSASSQELNVKFEQSAAAVTAEYTKNISDPLQKPLHARIDSLLSGQMNLPNPADAANDILLQLPDTPPGTTLAPEYTLPKEALHLVQSLYPGGNVAGMSKQVLTDQAAFESIVVDLKPHLVAAAPFFAHLQMDQNAPLRTLQDIHDDFNRQVARCVLIQTNSQEEAHKFMKLCGTWI